MPDHQSLPRPVPSGFTLIELMVTVAIVGVLAALAYPSFMDSLRKSRRSDAVAALTRIQHAQERFRANSALYSGALDPTGVDLTALKLPNASPDAHYTIALANATVAGYTATATANAGSPQTYDTLCRVFTITLNDLNGLMVYSSTNAGGVTTTSAHNPCWVK